MLKKNQNQYIREIEGFIRSMLIHIVESELCLQALHIRRRHLANKYWLKSSSVTNNTTIKI